MGKYNTQYKPVDTGIPTRNNTRMAYNPDNPPDNDKHATLWAWLWALVGIGLLVATYVGIH